MKLTNYLVALLIMLMANDAHSGLIKKRTTFSNKGSAYELEDYHFGTTSPKGSSKTNYREITINSFDSTLGTLNSVDIRFVNIFRLRSQVSATDYYASSSGWEDVHGKGSSGMKVELYLTDFLGTTTYDEYSKYMVANSSCSLNSKTTNTCNAEDKETGSSGGKFNLSNIDLSLFLDNQFKVNFIDTRYIMADSKDSDSQVYSYNKNSSWSGYIETYYNYTEAPIVAKTEVPEPSSFAILGLGLLGLGLRRRKANNHKNGVVDL